jgi:hypothetical protein
LVCFPNIWSSTEVKQSNKKEELINCVYVLYMLYLLCMWCSIVKYSCTFFVLLNNYPIGRPYWSKPHSFLCLLLGVDYTQ